MNKKGSLSFFILFFFLNILLVKAQNIQKEKQSLITILNTLETRFNVSFSYADDTVTSIEALTPPDDHLTLEKTLEFLITQTKLNFELLDSRFIVIKPQQKDQDKSFIIQNLEEVIVTKYLTSGITKTQDGSIAIKPESFGILPGLIEADVLQTIQALPGVLSADETVSNINIRGGTHDQNLLLWDGIKMFQSGHFFGLISAFNPHITKNINVYKNGTSAKYGDGVSSIIDMQLPDTIDNEFQASIGANLIDVNGYVKIPLSKSVELQLSTRRSVTDLITTPTYDLYKERIFQDSDLINQKEKFYFYDVTAKLLYDLSKKDKLRFHFLNVYNNLTYEEASATNDDNETLNSKLSQRNSAVSITYIRDWNAKLSSKSQIYVSNYDLDATNFDIVNNQRLIQENEVYDSSAKLDIDYVPSERLQFKTGYQFSEVGISNMEDVNNPLFRSFIKNVIRSHAVYAETIITPKGINNAFLRVGSRLTYLNKFNKYIFEPRLSFNLELIKHLKFEVLGEFKNQTTSQIIDLQKDFLGIEKRRWVLSNNSQEVTTINGKNIYPIPVIKSKQLSVGLHHNKNHFLASIESYIKHVDAISSRSQGSQNQFQHTNNIGGYEIIGTDILLNKEFSDKVSSWISYSFSMNDYHFPDLNEGKKFPNNKDIRHAITFAGTYTYNKLKFATGLNWHTGIPTTPPNNDTPPEGNTIFYVLPNSQNLNDYFRIDASATYSFNIANNAKATIGASVWNLLNKKNIINTYYTLDTEDNITKVENASLGITPNLSFRVSF